MSMPQDLYMRVHSWEKAEEERLAQENTGLGQRLFKRIGSIHLPEGLGIGGIGGRSSPTSDDEHSRGKTSQGIAIVGNGATRGAGKSGAGAPNVRRSLGANTQY
jgi:hypothetical protein